MGAVSIVIRWATTKEVVTLDLDRIRKGAQVEFTTESWSGEPRNYEYKTSSKFIPGKHGSGTLIVFYRRKDNRDLVDLECRFGRAVFELNPQMITGSVKWIDNEEEFDKKGRPVYGCVRRWKRFSKEDGVLSSKERERVERIARQQARFRTRLMMIDPKCAITGEREPKLLEAAHVVAAASDGSDIETNGLMLRVDLHRLFDAKLFSIRKNGQIAVSRKLKSHVYRQLLVARRAINEDTFNRIREAWSLKGK